MPSADRWYRLTAPCCSSLKRNIYPGPARGSLPSDLPDGRAFYQDRIRYFTTLDLSPEDIHATGQSEVKRIRAEMEAVIRKTGFKGDFRALHRVPAQRPALLRHHARSAAGEDRPGAEAHGRRTAAAVQDPAAPALRHPRNPGLQRAGQHHRLLPARHAAMARVAGNYYVNTYDLASRPLYEIEALSLHEAVPGHHLQIALQQELDDLPNFRRFAGFTAFVEGWALYSERLGLEVGFYQDPYSDFGRLSYEMWRACRLVVDTGMHALGWTRQQAIDFMAENTSSTLLNITNEVDRYIAWPGQALAYKLGELKIRELRALAEKELGTRFNLREFHDVVLLGGALPLDVLESACP